MCTTDAQIRSRTAGSALRERAAQALSGNGLRILIRSIRRALGRQLNPLDVLSMPDPSTSVLGSALEHALRQGGYITAERLAERLAPKLAHLPAHPNRRLLSQVDRAFGDWRFTQPDATQRLRAGGPELDLLTHNTSVETDLSSLNRYLRRRGLPACVRAKHSANWLDDLRFEPVHPEHGGKLVSVIMSARNARNTIPYAIDSVLGQSYRSLELLVCDDGSEDGTWDLLCERYGRNSLVRLFRSRESQGPYNVRNALIPLTRGEYITFQDSDDLAIPVRIGRQVRSMRRAGVEACVANWLRVRANGQVVFFWDQRALRLSIVSLMVKRDVLLSLLPYPSAHFGADQDLYRRLQQRFGHRAIERVHDPLLLGLWSESSLTRAPGGEALESGYRSPARRAYSELIFQRDLLGESAIGEAEVERMLRACGNYLPPRPLVSST